MGGEVSTCKLRAVMHSLTVHIPVWSSAAAAPPPDGGARERQGRGGSVGEAVSYRHKEGMF